LGSVVSSKRAHGIGQSLLPHQLGLGIPGGAEICAEIADLGYQRNRCEASLHIVPNDDGFATANDDVVNAFNTMPRSVQQEGLFSYAPDLLHLHFWSHSASTPLFNSAGTEVGASRTGGNQGDAFTQFYFAVGLQPLLDEMHTMMRAIEDRLGVPEADRGSIAAYFDDINISGTTTVVFELSLATEALFAKYGLKINTMKSHILGPKVHTTAGAPPGWRLEQYRASTLGRPLGGTDDQAEVVAVTMGANPPPLLALRRLPAHHRFLLVKHCISHRFDYLRKVLSHKVTGSVNCFRQFDSNIDLCLAEIVTPSSLQCLEAIRSLPVHNGGLGMPRLAGPEHARHSLVTASRVRNFLVAHHPTLVSVHTEFYAVEQGVIGGDLRHEMNMLIAEETGYDPDSLKDVDRVSRCAVARLQDRTFRDVLHQLRSDERTEPHAASFLSQANQHCGKWLTSASSYSHSGGTQLTDKHFIEAFRHRLALDFITTSGVVPLPCPCNRNRNRQLIDLTTQPFHCLVCPMNQPLVNERHDDIKKKLGNFLKARGYVVDLEPRGHGTIAFENAFKRPDIGFTKSGVTAYIDTVIAEPTAASNRRDGLHSSLVHGNGSSIIAELRKTADYSNMPAGIVVTPFALESTGRIGPSALTFLNIVCADNPSALKFFISELSYCLAAHLGRIIAATRSRTTPINYG
jgi:hypothetical protein